MAVDTFIDGVLDPEMRLRLRMGNLKTLNEALAKALKFEVVKRNLSSNLIKSRHSLRAPNVEDQSHDKSLQSTSVQLV